MPTTHKNPKLLDSDYSTEKNFARVDQKVGHAYGMVWCYIPLNP